MFRKSVVFIIIYIALLTGRVFAGEPSTQPTTMSASVPTMSPMTAPVVDVRKEPAAATESYWYGWQILGLEAAAWTVSGQLQFDSKPAQALQWVAFFGSSAVHAANGNAFGAVISPLIRIGFPLVGYTLSYSQAEHQDCLSSGKGLCLDGFGGLAIGFLAAEVFDIAFLAYGDRPVTKTARFVPQVRPTRNGAVFGFAGSF